MKILIPYYVSGLLPCLYSLAESLIEVDVIISPNTFVNNNSVSLIADIKPYVATLHINNNLLSPDPRTHDTFLDYMIELQNTNQYDYILPTLPEHLNHLLAIVNTKFNLKGIKEHNKEYCDKRNFYQMLETIEVPCPRLFKEPVFPLIVKPSRGSGGIGVKILHNLEQFDQFFSTDNLLTSQYQEPINGKYRHWEYHSFNSEYLVQEYIEGKLITISGRVENGNIFFDSVFDIETTPAPYCAEKTFTTPSVNITDTILADSTKVIKHIDLDNSPFLFDVIVSAGKGYFIDFGMRVTNNPQKPIHAIDNSYARKWIWSMMNQSQYQLELDKCCKFQYFNFEKGKIKSIECNKKELAVEIVLPHNNDVLHMSRNDMLLEAKGYFIVIGNTSSEVNQKANAIINSINITYDTSIRS
jgi:predicted ATP-grasp superfamily ATP-dependent carboligase